MSAQMDWQPINTAPTDGTVVEVTNEAMRGVTILARYGDYVSPWGNASKQWMLVRDLDRCMPMRPGSLVCPDRWRPAPPAVTVP